MPAARLPTPRSVPLDTWEHLRGAQGQVLYPIQRPCCKAHLLARSSGASPRDASWREAQRRGVTKGQ